MFILFVFSSLLKAYSMQDLVGYIGGYIGLFLGVALMQIPRLILTLIETAGFLPKLGRTNNSVSIY